MGPGGGGAAGRMGHDEGRLRARARERDGHGG